jgi:hypothetical protein
MIGIGPLPETAFAGPALITVHPIRAATVTMDFAFIVLSLLDVDAASVDSYRISSRLLYISTTQYLVYVRILWRRW